MVYLWTGTPGSGKSYHAANLIFQRMQNGQRTICNFDIDRVIAQTTKKGYKDYMAIRDECEKNKQNIPKDKLKGLDYFNKKGRYYYVMTEYLKPELFYYFAAKFHERRAEHQTMVIIDEASILFNARESTHKSRMDWIKFFQCHRHYGYDIILITQKDRMIDRQIRGLVDYEVQHRDVRNYRFTGRVISALFGGHLFIAVQVYYGFREKIGQEFYLFNKRIANIYDTFAHFVSVGAGGRGAGTPPPRLKQTESKWRVISEETSVK